MRIAAISGIRSQYMKLASLQYGVREWNELGRDHVELVSVNSGQHYDRELAGQYCEEYGLFFDIDLTGTHDYEDSTCVLASMIVGLVKVLRSMQHPDFVLVFGDANTTLAGAIAAQRTRSRLVHVEAGLRTYDRSSPEEANRVVADHLASHHFTSSHVDGEALKREGIDDFVFSGDVIRDLVTRYSPPTRQPVQAGSALVTIHREENTEDVSVIDSVLHALDKRGFHTVFIAHPRVAYVAERWGGAGPGGNVSVVSSTPHSRLLELLQSSQIVVTDSGALQREAYYLGRRILVYQKSPFWRSLIDHGFHRAIGGDLDSIHDGINWAVAAQHERLPDFDDFGDGYACRTIIQNSVRDFSSG